MTATSGRIGVPAPAAAPAAPATPVLSVTSPRAYRSLLRYGVTPFLLAIDLTAFGLACLLVGVRVLDLVLLPAVLALNASAGLYRSRLSLSVLDDAGQLAARALIAGALVVAGDALVSGSSSQVAVLVTAAAGIPIGLALRALGYRVVGTVRARGLVGHPTLVLGAGRVGAQVASLLLEHPEYGLRPVGFLDRDPLLDEAERPVRLLGGDDVLAETIVEFGVRDVVVAFGSLPESGLVEVIRTCDRLDCEIFFVPRLFELHSTNRDVDHVWGFPLVRMRRAAYRTFSWRVKRLLDVLAAAISLAALSPLMAVLAVAVRLEGGRGVIFRQVRVGLDGRPFQMLKFRTLRPLDDTESQTRWSVSDDQRLGPVGRLLRSTSMDELPQLWNILRGDMSVVGPRPERPHFVDTFTSSFPRYVARHRVPAGLTGWAQVHGLRGDTSIEERARFDNYYIENWSLALDLRIALRTISSVVRRRGG